MAKAHLCDVTRLNMAESDKEPVILKFSFVFCFCFSKNDYYHLHLLSTTFSLQSSDITQVKRDFYKNMAAIKLVSKGFFSYFCVGFTFKRKEN